MKPHKDIEAQLADAQGAWEQAPPPALWDRLEARLDSSGVGGPAPRAPRRWPWMVVGVAVLALAGLVGWQLLPSGDAAPMGRALAQLELPQAWSRNAVAPVAAAGTPAAKGLSFGENIGVGADRKGLLGSAGLPRNSAFARSSIFSMNGSGRLLMGGGVSPASASLNNNMATQPAYDPAGSNSGFNRPMVVGNSSGNPIDTIESFQQFINHDLGENAFIQVNPMTNGMNFNFVNPSRAAANPNLQHLKWLLGSWKTQGVSGGAIEEWRQKDEFTMEGRGYFVLNGDTVVTEQMRIEQKGPDVYYIIVKDQQHQSLKFRLRSSQGNAMIFQGAGQDPSEELVIEQNPGTGQVERRLQRNPSFAPQGGKPPKTEKRVLSR